MTDSDSDTDTDPDTDVRYRDQKSEIRGPMSETEPDLVSA